MREYINLVNEQGERTGAIEKLEAHQKGLLHEAFSLFVFNQRGEVLLQRRALSKYHSAGLWTNTCCSHPRVNETSEAAVHRRLREEMGFDCELREVYAFLYKTGLLEQGLIEHEFDHVWVGLVDDAVEVVPDPEEVCEYRWVTLEELQSDVARSPERYTAWFVIIMREVGLTRLLP